MRNAIELLKRGAGTEPLQRRAVEIIERQVGLQARLLDDLLNVNRIVRGKISLEPKRLDMVQLVRDAVEDHRGVFDRAELVLETDFPPEPLWISGDANRLAQVLGNLLQNAAKFTDPGGRVGVRVFRRSDPNTRTPEHLNGEFAAVAIRDTGVGISGEMLPRVFDTFAQADRSLDRSRGGLGLGLAMAKGLVELHGGRIHADSEGVDRGAQFTFYLPLESAPTPTTDSPHPEDGAISSLRILVVDDNRDSAETLRDLLEMSGHQVETAFSGRKGVEAARRVQPQVVLCDIGLPEMDGYAVAAALRQDPATASARLIAISGYGQEEDRRRSRSAGFDRHLTKPINLADLEALLGHEPERPR